MKYIGGPRSSGAAVITPIKLSCFCVTNASPTISAVAFAEKRNVSRRMAGCGDPSPARHCRNRSIHGQRLHAISKIKRPLWIHRRQSREQSPTHRRIGRRIFRTTGEIRHLQLDAHRPARPTCPLAHAGADVIEMSMRQHDRIRAAACCPYNSAAVRSIRLADIGRPASTSVHPPGVSRLSGLADEHDVHHHDRFANQIRAARENASRVARSLAMPPPTSRSSIRPCMRVESCRSR